MTTDEKKPTGNEFLTTNKQRYFKTGRKSLTESQIKELFSVITDIEHLGLIELAITTGLRRGDIVRIKQSDFDYKTRKLSFFESKKNRIHNVYMPEKVANTIQMIVNSNKKEVFIFKGTSEKYRGKGHMSSRTAYNILQRYLKKANLEQRPFHALRSTCIKMCQKRGWKPEETAELVGDSLRVIQEHYLVPSKDEMQEVSKEKAIL